MNSNYRHIMYSNDPCLTEETMFRYMEQQLSPKEQHHVERHLLECDLCSDAMEGLQLLKERNRIAALNLRVAQKINDTGAKSFNFRTITSIAAAIALLIGGIFLFSYFSSEMKEKDVAATDPQKTAKDLIPVNTEPVAPLRTDSVSTLRYSQTSPASNTSITQNEGKVAVEQDLSGEIAAKSGDQDNSIAQSVEKNAEVAPQPSSNPVIMDKEEEKALEEVAISKNSKDREKSPAKEDEVQAQESTYYQNTRGAAPETTATGKSRRAEKKSGTKGKSEAAAPAEKYTATVGFADDLAKGESTGSAANTGVTIDESPNIPGMVVDSTIVPDQVPLYPGGDSAMFRFISSNIHNATIRSDRNKTNSTRVVVSFIIDKDGHVRNSKIIQGISPEIDKEVLRVVNSMPSWKPGRKDNIAIPVPMKLPLLLEIH